MFESIDTILLGLATGVVFGFLLSKGRAAKHTVIVGQLLLKDHTVIKIMLTAVAVGAVGVYLLVTLGVTTPQVHPVRIGGVVLGAALFGVGLAMLGYCPGTTVAAVGEGNRDAAIGLAGMIVGAFLFVLGVPALDGVQKAIADYGELTLPGITSSSPWPWVGALGVAALLFYIRSVRPRER